MDDRIGYARAPGDMSTAPGRRGALLAWATVGFIALSLTPSPSFARPAKSLRPEIYIFNGCLPESAPEGNHVVFGCTTALSPPPLTRAYGLTYRRYGTEHAVATGVIQVCLGPHSEVREACLEGERSQAEIGESYRTFPATFRFFDVVSCTDKAYPYPAPRRLLYYGKISYSFAGRTWETHANLPPANATSEGGPAKCRPVRLSTR